MDGFLDPGEHALWVWLSYGATLVIFVFLAVSATLARRGAEAALTAVEAQAPSRARRAVSDDA